MLRVVLFTGGRGSGVLSHRLLAHPQIDLVLAINGYDDGKSTGEVRRFLGDALGPSDFRKNASRVAQATGVCSPALPQLLEARFPADIDGPGAIRELACLERGAAGSVFAGAAGALADHERAAVRDRLAPFIDAWRASDGTLQFGDCALGNLVFAGCYLRAGRRFNDALDDYVSLLGLPAGSIENVTDGTNAHLVAIDVAGRVLGTEAAVVDAARPTGIDDIFLIDRSLTAEECAALTAAGPGEAARRLDARSVPLALNPRLGDRLDHADLIIYAPGTQHSSLYPSYLTPGLADRIANNVAALKLLITNLQVDAEIAGASAVSLVDRAIHYLTGKGRAPRAAPALITHYLFNDPGEANTARPYVPLGQVETIEDPRLIRIGYFEEGVSGRHDAAKVLEPLLESWLEPRPPLRIGVLLYGGPSASKIIQSLLEVARALRDSPPVELVVFAGAAAADDPQLLSRLPFAVEILPTEEQASTELQRRSREGAFDYVGLFESSGMYRGDDLAALFGFLKSGRLDAVWGSRRLSVRDIDESYRFHYYRRSWLRAVSRLGSHMLSLAWLALFGRYVADTLSGVRLVRGRDAAALDVPLTHPLANQLLLGGLLRRRADLLEVPVQFISLSPERVRRTSIGDGLRALGAVVSQRFRGGTKASR